ncbi:hypothetical protein DH2020_028740 [Rehmannia glutinosa]|uniref:WAT1-related protein n=1 Tax=Rehmannia glutinosa TaxID=99300 RepID=A0ABR0VU50_REHGL
MNSKIVKKLTPYVGVIFLQFGSAGFAIVAKAALNQGSSHYTFSVYRNAIAAALFAPFAFFLERSTNLDHPPLIVCIPVIGQNMFYAGMKYSSATFSAALCNLLPALTFVLAWILRIEKVNLKSLRSHAKITGTLVTVGGAMIMTLISGPIIGLPWTHKSHESQVSTNPNDKEDPVKGAIMISIGCLGYASFYTLQRGNTSVWALGFDAKLLAYVYGGVVSSGITYYLSGVIMKEKGPVFVTSFNPLSMVVVAILSSFIFAEQMSVGKVTGATVIVLGLYLVIWGKSKDQKEIELIQQKAATIPTTVDSKADIGPQTINGPHAV